MNYSVKVSVVIPVYNTEVYIQDTLDCILRQSLSSIEVIVIDDGSTDNSYQVITSLAKKDPRVKVYRQENKGQSEARNFGLKLAQGEFIYFMDSDDLLETGTFQDCYTVCTNNNLDFLFFDATVFGSSGDDLNLSYLRCYAIKNDIYSGPDILKHLLKSGGFRASPCLNFIRSSYLSSLKLTFHPGIIHEDELFTLLLYIYATRVSFIDRPYFKRRLRGNSTMSRKFARKNIVGYFTVITELKRIKQNLQNKSLRSLVEYRISVIMHGLLYNSRSMEKKDRFFVLFHCVFYYWRYLSIKNITLLVFPKIRNIK